MKKEHFEILLEEMKGSFQIAFEGLDGVSQRLDGVDQRLEKLEAGQEAIIVDLRSVKRTGGLLQSIANDHETRLQDVEGKLRDHLDDHS